MARQRVIGPLGPGAEGGLELLASTLLGLRYELFSTSWFYRLSTAKIERMHTSHHNLNTSQQSAPGVMSSLAVNHAFSRRFKDWKKQHSEAQEALTGAQAVGAEHHQKPKRGLSPFEVFRKRALNLDRLLGVAPSSNNPCTSEKAEELRRRWEEAGDREREECDAMSRASKAKSRSDRMALALPGSASALPLPAAPGIEATSGTLVLREVGGDAELFRDKCLVCEHAFFDREVESRLGCPVGPGRASGSDDLLPLPPQTLQDCLGVDVLQCSGVIP